MRSSGRYSGLETIWDVPNKKEDRVARKKRVQTHCELYHYLVVCLSRRLCPSSISPFPSPSLPPQFPPFLCILNFTRPSIHSIHHKSSVMEDLHQANIHSRRWRSRFPPRPQGWYRQLRRNLLVLALSPLSNPALLPRIQPLHLLLGIYRSHNSV